MNLPICSMSPRRTMSWKTMSLGKCTARLAAGITALAGVTGVSGVVPRRVEHREPLVYDDGTYEDDEEDDHEDGDDEDDDVKKEADL